MTIQHINPLMQAMEEQRHFPEGEKSTAPHGPQPSAQTFSRDRLAHLSAPVDPNGRILERFGAFGDDYGGNELEYPDLPGSGDFDGNFDDFADPQQVQAHLRKLVQCGKGRSQVISLHEIPRGSVSDTNPQTAS